MATAKATATKFFIRKSPSGQKVLKQAKAVVWEITQTAFYGQ